MAPYILDSITGRDNGTYTVRFMTDDGLDAQLGGSTNMAGDWSLAQKIFWIENGPGETFEAERAIIYLSVQGTIDSGGFGNGPALVNGIRFYYYNAANDIYIDGMGKNFIFVNEDWGKHCYDTEVKIYGSGNQSYKARWSFNKEGGPLTLEAGDKLVAVLNDDINSTRGIDDFTIKIGGRYIKGNAQIAIPQPVITY